jgi:hypothetical protein
MKDKSFTRNDNVAFRAIEGTTFLASPYSKKIYPLNSVGNFIWSKLEKTITFQDLLNNIYSEFDVQVNMAENDLHEFLDELEKEKLIKQFS